MHQSHIKVQCDADITWLYFLHDNHQTPNSAHGASYDVDSNSDLYQISVSEMIYAILERVITGPVYSYMYHLS